MNEISKQIMAEYQVRKTREQKSRFIDYMRESFPELRVEEGGRPKCRNLVIGDVENADYILTAHYDTCARLPFPNFICPKNLPLYILYNLLVCIPFFIAAWVSGYLLHFLTDNIYVLLFGGLAVCYGLLYFVLLGGKPNPNTANDNTSGVLTLVELLTSLPEQAMERTAFVFFDHEESGLFGSSFFRKSHGKIFNDKLLINFDCVSDGEHIMLVQNKAARKKHGAALAAAFGGDDSRKLHLERSSGSIYPSDQMNFPCSVAVAAMHSAPVVGLYLTKIHTPKDTVLDEGNISFICRGITRLYMERGK